MCTTIALASPVSTGVGFTGPLFREKETNDFLHRSLPFPTQLIKELVSFSNHNYLLKKPTTSQQFVIRVPGNVAKQMADYTQEIMAMKRAEELGLTCLKIVSFDESTGLLLSEFLEGESLNAEKLKEASHLDAVIALLKLLHESDPKHFKKIFNPLARFSATLEFAGSIGKHLSDDVLKLEKILRSFKNSVLPEHFHQVPCHNDPSPENFFNHKMKLYLHDWELSGLNDPMWDLAHLSVIAQLEPEEILKKYGSKDPLAREKVCFFRPFVYFNSLIWAALEKEQKCSSMPVGLANDLYNLFFKEINKIFEGPFFKSSLKTLQQRVIPMSLAITPKPRILGTSADMFPNFKLKTNVSTLFLEHDEHILVLQRCTKEDQPHVWGVPGGKTEGVETAFQTLKRELKEETQIDIAEKDVNYHGYRYARVPGWDYIVHIFHATVSERPSVVLDPDEHIAYEWVSMYALPLIPLLKGQEEVFRLVYRDRLWHLAESESTTAEKVDRIVLRKKDMTLTFDHKKRLIINLIGTSGSGKGTQGDMISQLLGIPNISAGDRFRDEFRAKSDLGSMIMDFDTKHFPQYLPDEVPIGIMGKRLAEQDSRLGFILDGFPRTKTQGDFTREVVLNEADCHIPLYMDVPESEVRKRLPGREICPDCGVQVREFPKNPTPGFCPQASHLGQKVSLIKRVEDVETAKIDRRFKMFSDNRDAIVTSLAVRDPVTTFKLTNSTPPREVLHLLRKTIEQKLDRLSLLDGDLVKGRITSSITPFKTLLIGAAFFGAIMVLAHLKSLKKQ